MCVNSTHNARAGLDAAEGNGDEAGPRGEGSHQRPFEEEGALCSLRKCGLANVSVVFPPPGKQMALIMETLNMETRVRIPDMGWQ